MSRMRLIGLQVLVAVVALVAWQGLTTYAVFGKILLPPFFFSNPVDVGAQIVDWFARGVIWKHLWVTLLESILAFVLGSIGQRVVHVEHRAPVGVEPDVLPVDDVAPRVPI